MVFNTDIEIKIPSVTDLVTAIVLHTKITEIENKMPYITGLVTTAVLNTKAPETKSKIPDTNHFINTQEFKRLTKISFDARMKEVEKGLASKTEGNNSLALGDKNRRTSNI